MKRTLSIKIIPSYLLLMLLGIQALTVTAQEEQHAVKGVVVNTSDVVISGASVKEVGGTNSTRTDSEGRFTLNLSAANAALQVSYIGYVTQEVLVNSRSELQVILLETNEQLDEVVVVGYGTQRKSNVTGAISSVDMKQLESRPVINVVEGLQGTTPGLTIQQSNSQPGSRPAINIRGINTLNNNDPMVIIDGILGDIQNVNMADIENISVLKDAASAAIYGSRASNGVILITTKKGSKGVSRVSYDYIFAQQTPTFIPEIVDSWEYAELRNEALINSGRPTQFTSEQIADFRANGPNANWMKELYRTRARQQSHNLSLSGGGDKTSYLVSAAYLDQDRTLNCQDYGRERFNLRTNIETEVSDHFKVGLRAAYARNTVKDNAYWAHWLIEQATRMPSIYPI